MRLPVTIVALALAFVGSCERVADREGPAAPTIGRAEDAAALPAFDAGPADPESGEVERFRVELGDAPTRGPDDAPVTIVMFSDFECSFCLQGHRTLAALEDANRGKLRIAYKPYPLPMHSHALMAALAARTAQAQGKFWPFHDRLFRQAGLEPDTLFRYAQDVGMDVDSLRQDLASLEYGPEVRREMRQARRLGVDSTPTFFINGRGISGAQPLQVFQKIVDAELDLAQKWLKDGIAPADLYAHAIAEGYSRVEYTQQGRDLDPDGVFPVPVGESPTLGPATAPITIIAFGDFECPYCGRGQATVEQVRARYGDQVRVVYKHSPLPFHSFAFLAARASVAAQRQGKFWAFHDELYRRDAKIDEDVLFEVAKAAGLNMKTFRKQMNDLELDRAIEDDQRLAAALGVTGTPAYFINGRPLAGAQPEIQFRLLIEEELERAAAVAARGVSPDALYDALLHEPLPE